MSGTIGLLAFALAFTTGFLWFRRAFAVQLPKDRTGFVVAMSVAAILGIVALTGSPGWIGGTAATLSVVASAFFLILVSISAQKGGSGKLRVGAPIPDFTAPDENGEPFQLSSLAGRPFLLKFFRGHW
jgi:cytochrome oxidase Cu insertion factor (SCO1/SenC/PrrC family)